MARALRPTVVTRALLCMILLVSGAIATRATAGEAALAQAVPKPVTTPLGGGARVGFEVIPAQPTPPGPTSSAPQPSLTSSAPQPSPGFSEDGLPVTGAGPVPAWLLVVGSLLVLSGLLVSAVGRRS